MHFSQQVDSYTIVKVYLFKSSLSWICYKCEECPGTKAQHEQDTKINIYLIRYWESILPEWMGVLRINVMVQEFRPWTLKSNKLSASVVLSALLLCSYASWLILVTQFLIWKMDLVIANISYDISKYWLMSCMQRALPQCMASSKHSVSVCFYNAYDCFCSCCCCCKPNQNHSSFFPIPDCLNCNHNSDYFRQRCASNTSFTNKLQWL